MGRIILRTLGVLGSVALGACQGDTAEMAVESDAAVAPDVAVASATPAAVEMPAMGEPVSAGWFVMDDEARTAHITLVAGETPAKNYWNFNGYHDGNASITVPEGFTVTVDLLNQDPSMAHSVGVSALDVRSSPMPSPEPVFAGAVTPNATSMVDGTMPGETNTITFTADRAGTYAFLCYVPGHAATGMWIYFVVTGDGTAPGVREAL